MRRIGLQLLWSMAFAIGVIATTAAIAAENVVVKRFTTGGGADSVGMIAPSPDAEMVGPQALYAGQGHELFLLDQVNGRILQFDAKRPADIRALELPPQLKPTDLVVRKGHLYVWDGGIHTLRVQGPDNAPVRGLDELSTRGVDDEFVVSAFAQMGSETPPADASLLSQDTRSVSQPQTRQVARQNVASRGRGLLTVDVIPSANLAVAEVDVRAAGQSEILAKLHLRVRDRLGEVEFLEIDNEGHMFVLTENVPTSSDRMPSAFVARYSPAGSSTASTTFRWPRPRRCRVAMSLCRARATSIFCAPARARSTSSALARAWCVAPTSSTIRRRSSSIMRWNAKSSFLPPCIP